MLLLALFETDFLAEEDSVGDEQAETRLFFYDDVEEVDIRDRVGLPAEDDHVPLAEDVPLLECKAEEDVRPHIPEEEEDADEECDEEECAEEADEEHVHAENAKANVERDEEHTELDEACKHLDEIPAWREGLPPEPPQPESAEKPACEDVGCTAEECAEEEDGRCKRETLSEEHRDNHHAMERG